MFIFLFIYSFQSNKHDVPFHFAKKPLFIVFLKSISVLFHILFTSKTVTNRGITVRPIFGSKKKATSVRWSKALESLQNPKVILLQRDDGEERSSESLKKFSFLYFCLSAFDLLNYILLSSPEILQFQLAEHKIEFWRTECGDS